MDGGARRHGCQLSEGSDRWQRRQVPGGGKILEPRTSSCCQRSLLSPFTPGPALRDGFSHVLGLRIVVPEALRCPSGQLLRFWQSSPLQTFRRLMRHLSLDGRYFLGLLTMDIPLKRVCIAVTFVLWRTENFLIFGLLECHHPPRVCHDQTAGTTFQLSPRRAVGGMSGLTWHARTRVLVDENGTECGGVDAQIPVTESVGASGMLDRQCKILGRVFR